MHFKITEENLLYKIVGGSQLYGTNGPDSDTDYRGVCIPPYWIAWGVNYNFDSKIEHSEEEDSETHALAKFTNLATNCNPNIIEVLFAPEDKIVHLDKSFKLFLEKRDLFITKRAQYTFSGYAYSQLHRIKGHRAWLLNPIDHEPTREDYGLPVTGKLFDHTFLNAAIQLSDDQLALLGLAEEKHTYLIQEKKYTLARRQWDHYQRWLTERNASRAALESKYGYDTKHAMHLLRLLKMSKEIAEGKGVNPDRRGIDADFFKDVRFKGALTYDQLIEMAETLDKECKELYANNKTLPSSPNLELINTLYLDVCFEHYGLEFKLIRGMM